MFLITMRPSPEVRSIVARPKTSTVVIGGERARRDAEDYDGNR